MKNMKMLMASIGVVIIVIMMIGLCVEKSRFMLINNIWIVLSGIVVVSGLPLAAFIWLSKSIPIFASEERFYLTTLEKGQIKAFKIAGRIVGYHANLSEYEVQVDHQTGVVIPGKNEDFEDSFLWQFGAVWMGLGCEIAKSISLWHTHPFEINNAETKEGVQVSIKVQFVAKTVHAGLAMSYDNVLQFVENKLRPLFLDLLKEQGLDDIMKLKFQSEKDKGGSFKIGMGLSDEKRKALDLERIIGLEVIDLSVTDFEICDPEVRKAFESQEVQERKNKQKEQEALGKAKETEIAAESAARVAKLKAENELSLAEVEARTLNTKNDTDARRIEKLAGVLGINNATEVEKARALAGFKGQVLAIGANAPSYHDMRGKKE